MAQAHPTFAMRPFLPADASMLAEIFRASVEALTADEYSAAQQDAWMSAADDEEAFAKRLAGELTLVATLNGSLENNKRIDMLYVHPAVSGQGVGTMLCEALEKLASARGTNRVSVDASDSARDFFSKRGFVAQTRNTVALGGEWLANTTMEKALSGKEGAP
jgi:putative acetyltransferase